MAMSVNGTFSQTSKWKNFCSMEITGTFQPKSWVSIIGLHPNLVMTKVSKMASMRAMLKSNGADWPYQIYWWKK